MEMDTISDTAKKPMVTDDISKKVKELENRIAALEKKDDNLAMVLFSGDFDKAMAALIIANGCIAMDMKVTIFATFWGFGRVEKIVFQYCRKRFS